MTTGAPGRAQAWSHGRADGQARLVTEFRREGMTPAGAPRIGTRELPAPVGTSAQSHGQWTGEAPTGTPLARLARNSGEAMAFMEQVAVSTSQLFPRCAGSTCCGWKDPLEGCGRRNGSRIFSVPSTGALPRRGETLYMKHCVQLSRDRAAWPAAGGDRDGPRTRGDLGRRWSAPIRPGPLWPVPTASTLAWTVAGFVLASTPRSPFTGDGHPGAGEPDRRGALLSPLTYGVDESAASLFPAG
ncbi:MAG: hypothetical protein R3D03_13465 [Geminicoccaceae bacterium]